MAHPSNGEREPRLRRRWPRRAGYAALTILLLVGVSTAVNLVLEKRERARIAPYGERVPVTGGALNVWKSGDSGRPTIVLLSGLGTPAPAVDYAPLIRELDGFDVVVVEGFGYGYSDMEARPRTVENITTELHDALTALDIRQPFVLAGHSISGFYTLSYANRYPDEVSAVIGIDPTVTAAKEDVAEPRGGGINWGRLLETTGVVRAVVAVAPSLVEPPSTDYTADELMRTRAMTIWNYSNPALTDETARIGSNAAALRGVTYPDSMPVLVILAQESVDNIPGWVQQHEEQLQNVRHKDIVVLDGRHYLHWTQSKALADMITEFVGAQ